MSTEAIFCDHDSFRRRIEALESSNVYVGKTAKQWHDEALDWKRRALNAEIRASMAERDADLLADRLIEGSEGFES